MVHERMFNYTYVQNGCRIATVLHLFPSNTRPLGFRVVGVGYSMSPVDYVLGFGGFRPSMFPKLFSR